MKRFRAATQRHPGRAGSKKRRSIFHRRQEKSEADLEHTGKNFGGQMSPESDASDKDKPDVEGQSRTVYFNIPLPPEAKNEEGNPKIIYARNKIRTAKYTPLSFIPKNLWLQFHSVANIYFLLITILQVRIMRLQIRTNKVTHRLHHAIHRYSPSLVPRIPASVVYR
jgi:phospholipid-translocating ATPase